MHIAWEQLETFLAVAEQKSFSGAARELDVTQPTISRRILALEKLVNKSLFRRDVEGAHLTEGGARLLPGAKEMARFARELGHVAENFDQPPSGLVRIAGPPALGFEFVVPLARDLKKTLPDIRVQAISGVDARGLTHGQAELGLFRTRPESEDLITVAHIQVGLAVFASKKYAKGSQSISPTDVDWVTWAPPNEHMEPLPSLRQLMPDLVPAFSSNDYNVQARAVAEGMGAMVLPRAWSKNPPYERFVELDVGLSLPPTELYLVSPKNLRWLPRVQRVASFWLSSLAAHESISVETFE